MTTTLLLRGIQVSDKVQHRQEERMARAAAAEVAIESLNKMEERLANSQEENIDSQILNEVSVRVIGNDDADSALMIENLERHMRLNALRAERGEHYHLRVQQKISNETLMKLLHDLDLLEALLVEHE